MRTWKSVGWTHGNRWILFHLFPKKGSHFNHEAFLVRLVFRTASGCGKMNASAVPFRAVDHALALHYKFRALTVRLVVAHDAFGTLLTAVGHVVLPAHSAEVRRVGTAASVGLTPRDPASRRGTVFRLVSGVLVAAGTAVVHGMSFLASRRFALNTTGEIRTAVRPVIAVRLVAQIAVVRSVRFEAVWCLAVEWAVLRPVVVGGAAPAAHVVGVLFNTTGNSTIHTTHHNGQRLLVHLLRRIPPVDHVFTRHVLHLYRLELQVVIPNQLHVPFGEDSSRCLPLPFLSSETARATRFRIDIHKDTHVAHLGYLWVVKQKEPLEKCPAMVDLPLALAPKIPMVFISYLNVHKVRVTNLSNPPPAFFF